MEKKIRLWQCIVLIYFQLHGDAETISRYFWANYQHFQKNKTIAEKWFTKLFEDSVPFAAYEGYLNFLFSAKQYEKIYQIKETIITHLSSSSPALLILSDVLALYKKEDPRITDLLFTIHKKQPNDPELTLKLAISYLGNKEYEKAITVLDSFLNKSSRAPNLFLFHFLKAQIFVQLNRMEDALEEISKTVEIVPHFNQAWLLSGMLYEQLGHTQLACEAYTNCLAGITQKSIQQKISAFITQYQQLISVLQNNEVMRQELYRKSKQFYTERKYPEAMRCISALLQCNYAIDSEMYNALQLLKIDILLQQKLSKTACSLLHECITQSKMEPGLYAEKLFSLTKNMKAHLKTCYVACTQKSESPETLSKCVDFFLCSGDTKGALDSLTKLFSQPLEQPALFDATASLLAFLCHQECQFERLKTTIEIALSKDCTSIPFLNSAAYFYATKGKNVEKAAEYIRLVLAKSQKYEYLDTYAFILYKQDQREQARSIWHQLLSERDNDPYVLFHYAQASHKEGQHELTRALLTQLSTTQLPLYLQNKVAKLNQKLQEEQA